jgi:hypothetical protein
MDAKTALDHVCRFGVEVYKLPATRWATCHLCTVTVDHGGMYRITYLFGVY